MSVEICQIKLGRGWTHEVWEAWVGSHKVAQGQKFGGIISPTDDERLSANIEFVSQLTAQGWEPISSNSEGAIVSMKRVK